MGLNLTDRLVHQVKPKNLNYVYNPEFSIQFRMYFHTKNLKSERNNPWFKPWFRILLQPIVYARRWGQCLEYLGYITLGSLLLIIRIETQQRDEQERLDPKA